MKLCKRQLKADTVPDCVCDGFMYDRFSGDTIEEDFTLEETAACLAHFREYEESCYNEQS